MGGTRERRRRRGIQTAGIVAAAAAATSLASCLTTRFLVKAAIDRELPKSIQRAGRLISGERKDNAYLAELEAAARRLEARESETVQIVSRDGTRLVGHFIPCPNAKRLILAMHGWRSSWSGDFGTIADFWQRSGCSVLYAEQRGQNGSGGDYMGFGLVERYDVLDWLHWVEERCGGALPVYLAGVSMGATTVLMAAGLDLPACVHGIAGDCGFTSPREIWKHVANHNLHMFFGLRGMMADAMFRQKVKAPEYSTLEAMERCRVPVLLIHGGADRFVPVEMTYRNYAHCAAPKRLLIVPGAGHGMSYFVDRERYEAVVREFWDTFD